MSDDRELDERIAWLEDAVRRIAGSVSPPITLLPHPGGDEMALSDEVRALIDAGNKMGAIQLYRQETGTGLAEAQRAIEAG